MKDQFFGDKRDYFKYDLVIEIATCLGLRRFTNIVMLTRSAGSLTRYNQNNGNPALYRFLQDASAAANHRRVSRLREFFLASDLGIEYLPYRDSEFFNPKTRKSYFESIPPWKLEDSVILVDPDKGLTPPKGKPSSAEHVMPKEICGLKDAMTQCSVLVLLQFADRKKGGWPTRFANLKERLGPFIAIYDGDLAFLCMTKSSVFSKRLLDCLCGYGNKNDHRVTLAK